MASALRCCTGCRSRTTSSSSAAALPRSSGVPHVSMAAKHPSLSELSTHLKHATKPRTLHIANARNVSAERKGVAVTPPEPEMSAEELKKYEEVVAQLEGRRPDFWEGSQWNGLGFLVQYLWVFGIGVSIVACIVAVRTYNTGATDFKSTAVFKDALEQQAGDFVDDSSEPSVFDESNKEAP